MALSPEIEITEDIVKPQTSRTYKMDFESGRITSEVIDGLEAIKQFIHLALRTVRYAHAIYSDDIGSEILDLLSDIEVTIAYKKMELPRLITESIIYDERITSVTNFEIEHIGDALHVRFTVSSTEGFIELEEVF